MRKGRLLNRSTVKRIDSSRKQERRLAKDLGGKVQPGSGNQWHSKGDVKVKRKSGDRWLIEAKHTEKKQFTLKEQVLKENILHATMEGAKSVVQVEFGNNRYAIVEWHHFQDLLEKAEEDAE